MNDASLLVNVVDCGKTDDEFDICYQVGRFGRDAGAALWKVRIGFNGFQHSHRFVCLAHNHVFAVFLVAVGFQFAQLFEYFYLNHSLDDWKDGFFGGCY